MLMKRCWRGSVASGIDVVVFKWFIGAPSLSCYLSPIGLSSGLLFFSDSLLLLLFVSLNLCYSSLIQYHVFITEHELLSLPEIFLFRYSLSCISVAILFSAVGRNLCWMKNFILGVLSLLFLAYALTHNLLFWIILYSIFYLFHNFDSDFWCTQMNFFPLISIVVDHEAFQLQDSSFTSNVWCYQKGCPRVVRLWLWLYVPKPAVVHLPHLVQGLDVTALTLLWK